LRGLNRRATVSFLAVTQDQLQPKGENKFEMSYFRITLVRSAIGLPRRTTDVLKALGLKKRMATVFHPVSQSVAGQIMKVKELVEVQEVDKNLTKQELHLERKPDPGYYVERTAAIERTEKRGE
jgi:large subunit ribosomal protein L30